MTTGGPFDCLPWALTVGTPASLVTTIDRLEYQELSGDSGAENRAVVTAPPIVTIRPAGEHGSELLLVWRGDTTVVPLSWGHMMNLNAELAAAIARHKES